MPAGVTIVVDEMRPLLRRLHSAVQENGLVLVAARAVGTEVKDHLIQKNAERHRPGGQGFYEQAARSVTTGASDQGALITVTQTGFRQRLFGGPIDPKTAGALTIPASPEAYGHRAREFSDLMEKKVFDDEGNLRSALVRRPSTPISFRRRKQKDGSIKTAIVPGTERGEEVMFWLVRHVDQDADPSVLPDQSEMQATAIDAMNTRLKRLSGREEGSS